MKNWIRKIWDWIVKQLYKVPFDKWLHFMAGVLLAAFFCITLGMKVCSWPLLFIGFAKEFFDKWTTEKWDWYDYLATMIGAIVIQLLVIL